MNRARHLILPVLLCLAAAAAAQEWRGAAAVELEVKGKPRGGVAEALVILRYQQVDPPAGPRPVLTDSAGRAVLVDLAAGVWEIEVSHPDFLSFVAVVLLEAGKKPSIQASFLQASGSSLTPIRVKVMNGKGKAPSASVPLPPEAAARLAQRRPPPPPPTAPVAAAPPVPRPGGQSARPAQPLMPEPELRPLPQAAQPAPTPVPPPPEPEPAPVAEPAPASVAAPAPAPAPAAATPPSQSLPAAPPPAEPVEPTPPAAAVPPGDTAASPSMEPAAVEVSQPEPAVPEPPPAPVELPVAAPEPPPIAPDPPTPGLVDPPAPSPAPAAPASEPEPEPGPEPEPSEPAPPAPAPEPAPPSAPAALVPPEPAPTAMPRPEAPPEAAPAAPATAAVPEIPTPATPAPGPLGPTLRSYRDRTCVECRTGEFAISVEAVIGPATTPCGDGLEEGGRELATLLGGSIALELKEVAAPAAVAAGLMGPSEPSARVAELLGEASDACRLVAAVIPKAGRFRGVRMEAADASGVGDCQADRPCPVGGARWIGQPRVAREPSSNVIWGLFVNETPDRARRARLTVYFAAPYRAWDPPR